MDYFKFRATHKIKAQQHKANLADALPELVRKGSGLTCLVGGGSSDNRKFIVSPKSYLSIIIHLVDTS